MKEDTHVPSTPASHQVQTGKEQQNSWHTDESMMWQVWENDKSQVPEKWEGGHRQNTDTLTLPT